MEINVKTSFFAMLLLLLLGQGALGQNAIYSIHNSVSASSLIRNYNTGIDIVYNTPGGSSFFFIDRNTGCATEASINNLQAVTDMEIVGNELYFCGIFLGYPVIGRFDISSFFFGGGQAEIVNITTRNAELKKLEIQYISSHDVHVYVLGLVKLLSPIGPISDYTALFDCMFDGTNWNVQSQYEQGYNYRMYDLTVTDRFLYVVGEKYGGYTEYSNTYSLPAPGNNPLLPGGSNIITMSNSLTKYYYPISETLTETLQGDSIVTACYGFADGYTGIIITQYSAPNNIVVRYVIPNMTTSTRFIDLKYNPADKKLYLIPDKANSVITDLMYVFDLSTGNANVYQSLMTDLCSVDIQKTNKGAVVSGIINNGEIGVWVAGKPNDDCSSAIGLPVYKTIRAEPTWLLEILVGLENSYRMYSYPHIENHVLEIKCQ